MYISMQICKYSKAFSLIEILISWLILCVILLGLLRYEIDILRMSTSAYLQTVAVIQVQSMLERLRANAGASFRMREQSLWNLQNAQLLPKGMGDVQCQNEICQINLHWNKRVPKLLTMTAHIGITQ